MITAIRGRLTDMTQRKTSPRSSSTSTFIPQLLLGALGTTVLMFFASSIAVIGPQAGYFLIGVVALSVFLLLLPFRESRSRNWMFVIALVFPLILALLRKATGVSLIGAWQVAIMLLALAGVSEFWKSVCSEKLLQWFLAVFSVFLALAALSTLTGRSHFYPAAYQLFSDFKPLLAIILGYALCWDSRMERLLWFVVRWLWLPAMLLVFFEWIAPGTYFKIFSVGYGRASVDPSGLFPSRATGVFDHPSILASSAAALCILSVARATMANERRSYYFAGVYFLLVVFSVQRQELAACLAAIFLVVLLARPDRMATRLVLILPLSVVAAALFWAIFEQTITRELSLWGFGTMTAIEHPRAQIYSGAWHLAQDYFPLGSGLGTFGGAGAEKFDTSLYDHLGFRSYWWYRRENYLMDTYWPNSIAESGLFGAAALLGSYLLLFAFAVKRCIRESTSAKRHWAAAAALMLYMLLISLSSPAFQDLRLFVLPALMFGIASQASKNSRDARN